MIGIVDYGGGNLTSVFNGIKFFSPEAEVNILTQADQLEECSKILLPGVGAFGVARQLMYETGIDQALIQQAEQGKLILGVCLGMQLLASKSYEDGEHQGLGLIPGEVKKFKVDRLKVPHMGWNEVFHKETSPLLKDIQTGRDFYFVHSYHFICENDSDVLATSVYGEEFCCAVNRENVFGVQFHPEKSQRDGLLLLKNFVEM